MPRRTPPSFDFFPDDFTGGTYYLSPEAFACYVRCLCYQWGNDSIPDDHAKLAQISNLNIDVLREHWPAIACKFVSDGNGGLYNERLKSEKDKKLEIADKRAVAGKQGGRPRKSNCKAKGSLEESKNKAKGSRKKEVGRRKKEDGSGTLEGGSGKVDPQVALVFEHYRKFHPRSRPAEKEARLVAARFSEGYSVDDLTLAIDGCHKSPHHCGQNDSGTPYQTLELIVRDSKHVTQFMQLATEEANGKGRAKNQGTYERMMRRFADE